jgi:hypothetical protein
MANPEHVRALLNGAWRLDSRLRPDLSGANLFHADLSGAYLAGANLENAGLSEANLRGAYLSKAYLSGVDLSGANLREAHLFGANLHGANLRQADLREANLGGAYLGAANLIGANLSAAFLGGASLVGANLSGARLGLTILAAVDLRFVSGLEEVVHSGPSTIGVDTIYRGDGKIPESFLRGAGVPETFLTFMKSLPAGTALDFYSCFISYSTKDQEFADRLYAHLQERGVRCWFAPHDIQGGRKIHEQIEKAIRVYDKLLLILSDASMSSGWVKTEIANARAREVEQNRRMLFPITLVPFDRIRTWKSFDADTGIDSAREIREYLVPDFSNWKNDASYQQAFERLLRDLKADATAAGL